MVVSGRVADPEGNAIPQATVRAVVDGLSMWERNRHAAAWVAPLETQTDSEGRFAFTTPTGLAVDAKRKRLYVVELKANRVRWLDFE